MEDGGDLREGARTPELLDALSSHEVIRRHAEPACERRQTVDIGLAALGQAGERGGADTRLLRHLLPVRRRKRRSESSAACNAATSKRLVRASIDFTLAII